MLKIKKNKNKNIHMVVRVGEKTGETTRVTSERSVLILRYQWLPSVASAASEPQLKLLLEPVGKQAGTATFLKLI